MNFSKVVGKIDPKLVKEAERKLSEVFLELSLDYNNKYVGTRLGGDPFIFSLVCPSKHICDDEFMAMAGTDGRCFYWKPSAIIKKTKLGLRLLVMHEAFHVIYSHPTRFGNKNVNLWRIAIDYIVNDLVFEDLKKRGVDDPGKMFYEGLGDFISLEKFADSLKTGNVAVSEYNSGPEAPCYFADIALKLKTPEEVYNYLYSVIPKCSKCGGICGSCEHCGKMPEKGELLDDHMKINIKDKELTKKLLDAVDLTKKMAGSLPSSIEDELGELLAPKISWQDIIRTKVCKARMGGKRNDWTRFNTRQMFNKCLVPKRKSYFINFGCLLDTSGSMSKDDIAFGISQLISIDDRGEGTIVPADAEIYWDRATKIKKCNREELSKIKIVGRGGTMFGSFFKDYKKEIGDCDFLIVITDGYLLDSDTRNMENPGVDVVWLITSDCNFDPPFGKVYKL